MNEPAIVVFDGTCNLCNGSIRFMIANDPAAHFRFAPSQSAAGTAALRNAGRDPATTSSIMLIDASGVYDRSDAALRIAGGLRLPWRAFGVLLALPRRVRDPIYDVIARNRYRWFGKRDFCPLPTAEQRARFL